MTNVHKNDKELADKKVWQSLNLETLSVPSATKSGSNRLDPAETFFAYRPS